LPIFHPHNIENSFVFVKVGTSEASRSLTFWALGIPFFNPQTSCFVTENQEIRTEFMDNNCLNIAIFFISRYNSVPIFNCLCDVGAALAEKINLQIQAIAFSPMSHHEIT